MAFEFFINDQRVDNPLSDLELSTKIKRDNDIGGIVITQDASFEWFAQNDIPTGFTSGYSVLKTLFDEAICNEATIQIYDRVSDTETFLTHTGVIKLTQLEFDEQWVSLSTKVQDNSFYSYIFNNRSLKVDLRAILTKNRIGIEELDWYSVDCFNGCTGQFGNALTGALYKGYAVTDVIGFILKVITDEKVTFQSDWLTGLTYPIFIFKGESLLNPYTIYPLSNPVFEISLEEILMELNKLQNLFFWIDTTDPAAPIFRLENDEATFSQQAGITFTEPLRLKTSVDATHLYSKVSVGSNITVDGTNCTDFGFYTMNEAISYYGFKLEDFFPLGQCNTNAILNLVNEWVISNNVIQDIVVGQSNLYLDNYILVECDGVDSVGLTANAYPYDFFGQTTPPFFYNLGLNNYTKLQRHSEKFETIFGNFLGIGSLGFKALLGDDPTQDIIYQTATGGNPNFIPPGGLDVTAIYPNETTNGGFDGNNSYDNITGIFSVTVDGDWSWHHHLHFEVDGITNSEYFNVLPRITLLDSGLNVKATIFGGLTVYSNNIFDGDATLVASAVAGDTVVFSYTIEYFPNQAPNQQNARTVTIMWDSYFEANGTPDGGISITAGNRSIKKLLHEFEYSINQTDWRTIITNPTGLFPFIKDGVTRYGWIWEMNHNDQTGLTKVQLISSSNATV